MPPLTIFCPGGMNSQSGTAVKGRYPDAIIESCGDSIRDVPPLLEKHPGPYAIPMWNSHHGEINAAEFVWNSIESEAIKLSDAWPTQIEFWFLRRIGQTPTHGKIGSVPVAEAQCSGFLARQKATLQPYSLTTVAFTKYKEGDALDGILVAPNQGENEAGYEIVARQTANPNNFTSFVRLVPTRAFEAHDSSSHLWLTGVTMRPFDVFLREAEQYFFEQMLGAFNDLKDIPRLLFVLKRTEKVGLLFEGVRLHAGDLLDVEELQQGKISIYEDAGVLTKLYTEELHGLLAEKFPALNSDDFILHQGFQTCLFACPPLGIYTHGYEVETVEPVVRFYISRLFQLWDDEVLKCTAAQTEFFERHKEAWLEKRSTFMQFKAVSATGA